MQKQSTMENWDNPSVLNFANTRSMLPILDKKKIQKNDIKRNEREHELTPKWIPKIAVKHLNKIRKSMKDINMEFDRDWNP